MSAPDPALEYVLSPANLKDNVCKGDDLVKKTDGTLCLYSINPNGLTLDRSGRQYSKLLQVIQEVQADITGMLP